jgi:hypothetical protein
MAEARRAIEPLPALSLDTTVDPSNPIFQAHSSANGVSIFIPHPRHILRNVIRSAKRTYLKMHQAFFPLPVPGVFAAIAGTVLFLLLSPTKSRTLRDSRISHFVWNLDSRINPFHSGFSNELRVAYLAFNTTAAFIFSFTAVHRMLLRGLLSYTAWMVEGRGKKSLRTVVWGFLLKYLYIRSGSKVMLAYQTSLPHFPIPSLEDTAARYMGSMEGLMNADERAVVQSELEQFLNTVGPKLQRYLQYRRLTKDNYLADWWRDFVYLRGRESIMINSNYYGTTFLENRFSNDQASRAAFYTYTLLTIGHEIQAEKISPMVINGLVPMCMDQYRYAFGTTRIPMEPQDRLVTEEWSNTRHIIIMNRGRVYKFNCFDQENRLLPLVDFYDAIRGVLEDKSPASPEEDQLGALTAWSRSRWAQIRESLLLRNNLNRRSIESIERSLFVICLDDEEPQYDHKDLSDLGKHLIAGPFGHRWFDKSFNLIFTKNAYAGMNGEHAWSDAPCFAHLFEICMAREATQQPYGQGGILKAALEPKDGKSLTVAERLRFHFNEALTAAIREAYAYAGALAADLDLCIRHHDAFGKGRIKKCKVGPDAFVQMALQLAFFRNQGVFVQTYESASARLYVRGRTETIRSCSRESCEMVHALCDGQRSLQEKAECIRRACAKHTNTTIMAMTGRGVDRHLFGLYVVAVGTGTDSPFLRRAMGRGWKLSTSQVPVAVAADEWKTVKDRDELYVFPCGGFGPVADDGYGVCYTFSGENHIFFHVSSKKSCPTTSSTKMQEEIFKAMRDLADVLNPPEQ